MSTKIEKPWAVDYRNPYPQVGRVVKEEQLVFVKNLEDQAFKPLAFGPEEIKRFETAYQAIEYILELKRDYQKKDLEEKLKQNFPSFFSEPSFRTTGLPLGEHGKDWEYDDLGRPVSLNFRKSTLETIDIPHL